MNDAEWLAARFEENRSHLRAVAYRMLGSTSEADDAVQEAWLRLSASYSTDIENLTGWLTTVVGRVCLDMLRSRRSRREDPFGIETSALPHKGDGTDPEHQALLADSVGLALLVVLETLEPAERLAFVLHDMFGVPFPEIAPIVERTPAAARQLASRARRRVQGIRPLPDPDLDRHREIVDAFLVAARGGDLEALMAILDPDVVLRADRFAVRPGAPTVVRGATAVASGTSAFASIVEAMQLMVVDGAVGILAAPEGRRPRVMTFTIDGGRIVELNLVAEPERLRGMELSVLD